ncbi:YhjD/YihY/BrkB family envelope integrity protein [Desertimonas flava]|uniref:YhjD/YihY/BrkB family envelope integrity protein n=1 Tax=Desertimonas flava TaxID=2064846 RepID=UPI0013C4A18C|nr:YhjD/YihY/BrkB family envelope integrity protein [Desertimonas flava]
MLARDREAAGSVLGGAIAFRLFLFVVPFVLLLVGLAGFMERQLDEEQLESAGIAGTIAAQIDAAVTQPDSARWLAIGLGLVGMVSTGRTLSKVLAQSSCLAWRVPVRARPSARLIGTMIGLFIGVGLVAVVVNSLRLHFGVGAASASFAVAAALYAGAWMVLSGLLPHPTSDPGVLVPGGLIVGIALAGMQAVSQLYLPRRFASASQLYGALGITVVTLGWFFIAARAMVMSFVVDAVVYERFGSVSRVVFALPVLRRLPSRWPQIGRVFQLDEDRG